MYFSRAVNIIVVLTAIIFFSTACTADEPAKKDGITWIKYDEGLKLAAKLDKFIFIDFYTDWCKWCHKMDKDTFSDKEVIDYFNRYFIGVKVNGESKIKMNLPEGRFSGRDLARMYGVRGYPTYWFLKPDGAKINSISSYMPPIQFLPVMKYFGERHYENMTFNEFMEKNYKKE